MDPSAITYEQNTMIEVEKKYRLDKARRAQVINELKEVGAQFQSDEDEENIIYGGGTLDTQGAVLRIRITNAKSTLTFKRRLDDSFGAKTQLEHETVFENAAELQEILRNLGLEPRVVYEKRRATWKFRETEVVLDELPFGDYMEIEGSLMAIREAEMFLDIEDLEVEQETYPRLTMRLGVRRGNVIESRLETGRSSAS